MNRNSIAASKVVSILIILAIVLAMPVSQAHAALQVKRRIGGGKLLWSADFESGRQDTYFNAPNQQNIAPGNNPGEVVTSPAAVINPGTHAGYYYITSNPTGGWVRDYWSIDWGSLGKRPTTHDFIVEAWVYVPNVTLTGPVSFITIGFDGYNSVTLDLDRQALPNRYLKIFTSSTVFTDANGYQTANPKVQFPFDEWVKLDMEVHYRPSTDVSNIIVYQDDVKIIDFKTYSVTAQPQDLLNMHFGLYAATDIFSVYDGDLALYDIS